MAAVGHRPDPKLLPQHITAITEAAEHLRPARTAGHSRKTNGVALPSTKCLDPVRQLLRDAEQEKQLGNFSEVARKFNDAANTMMAMVDDGHWPAGDLSLLLATSLALRQAGNLIANTT
jgi:hypothetical protein